jgi:hypothetical protein
LYYLSIWGFALIVHVTWSLISDDRPNFRKITKNLKLARIEEYIFARIKMNFVYFYPQYLLHYWTLKIGLVTKPACQKQTSNFESANTSKHFKL